MNVGAVVMEILRASGVRYLFGNPGTTELSFLDALPDSRLEYIVALQEATAVAAADGYAQASGQVGVVNLHVLPGVANGVSILHNASRSHSPLLATAGYEGDIEHVKGWSRRAALQGLSTVYAMAGPYDVDYPPLTLYFHGLTGAPIRTTAEVDWVRIYR